MRTYLIRTFGCQMNKHDSERVAGMLRAQGLRAVDDPADADVVVFMTCCVRENADERLVGQVATLKSLKTGGRPDVLIAVGGCIGQRDGQRLVEMLPHVDVVFGTHNISHLPALLETARTSRCSQVEVLEASEEFASDLPSEREHPWHAWVPITVGCDNFCSYCIVPYVRGRERSRPLEDITA
ncbi:MAG: tRNA (N6-isopentenyl adenosine(37)-C2)-methylthiotransferase MiaB, partial [Actinobacteria bacterium]